MRRFSTLQRTLSLHFLLVAIIPTLAFGFLAIGLLHRHLERGVYQRNQLMSRDIADSTNQFLIETERDLTTVARVVEAAKILRPEAVNDFLDAFVLRSGRFETLYVLDRSLHVRYAGLNPQNKAHRADFVGNDFSQHALLKGGLMAGEPIWSDTFVSMDTGVPSVSLALPLQDGVLLGNISLQLLSDSILRFARGAGDSYAIVDHTGTLVAASNPVMALQRVNLSPHASIKNALRGHSQINVEHHGDQELLESTAPVARTGWVAWVGADLGKEMATVDHIRDLLAGFMLLALIFAGCTALIDSRRLLLPLSLLTERASQIGSGIYDFDFVPTELAEIDSLAESLQKMSSEIRERERSLVDSEKRFRDLVNSIEGVVWEMDIASGRYLFVSNQAESLFGYAPSMWGDSEFWLNKVHPADRERAILRNREDLSRRDHYDYEYRFLASGGRELWIRDLVTVIKEERTPRKLLGVMIDATLRKRASEELEQYRSDLEQLVAQRTQELQAAQNELVQKERLVVLGQLTATVSHEIRNPLGTVANALYLLRETLGDDCLARAARPLALAERSVDRCDGIISELLDFTRRRELKLHPVAIDSWLDELLDELVWPPDIHFSRSFESCAVVQVDCDRFRRAIINVIDNAMQAIDENKKSERRLEIRTARVENRCEIQVQDTGIGIPEEIKDRIYEPMFSTKSFGVGLGVPIIRNIMEDHGGGVVYASQSGVGTTVTLWLPLTV